MNGTNYLQIVQMLAAWICFKTKLTHISGGRVTHRWKHFGRSINQWLPCPLAIWVFVLNDNLVKNMLNRGCCSPPYDVIGRYVTLSNWPYKFDLKCLILCASSIDTSSTKLYIISCCFFSKKIPYDVRACGVVLCDWDLSIQLYPNFDRCRFANSKTVVWRLHGCCTFFNEVTSYGKWLGTWLLGMDKDVIRDLDLHGGDLHMDSNKKQLQ